jgi:uncharacterized membrane protein (DUF441 family)
MAGKSSKMKLAARNSLSALKRATRDAEIQASAGALAGGVAAAFIDKEGISRVGDTFMPTNAAIGLGGLVAVAFLKKFPFRPIVAGAAMAQAGVGSYILTHELMGNTSLELQPFSS